MKGLRKIPLREMARRLSISLQKMFLRELKNIGKGVVRKDRTSEVEK